MSRCLVVFLRMSAPPVCVDCPVDLFFVLDTSESVALRAKPPEFYINQIKSFTKLFVDELKDLRQTCDRYVTWNSGALHYSDEIELVKGLVELNTMRDELKRAIDTIKYIGKGTYTDCAIKEGIAQLLRAGSYYHENKYIVVVTDGHPVTGYKEPCGGIQEAASEARQHGIKVFAVAITPDQEDTRLSIIATDMSYRQNFTAADNTHSTQINTIRTIIDIIGDPGPRGEQGREGSSGPNGDPGEPGRDGSPGYRGDEGSPGPEGPKGPRGIKGAPGDRGLLGERGDDGTPGNGTEGCHGFQGYPGPRGDSGEPGSRGTPGPKGDDGEPGDPGPDVSPCFEHKPSYFSRKLLSWELCLLICVCLECKCGPLDVVFIVDSSESIGASNFAIAKDFIITVIDRLIKDQQVKFGANESRIGVVQYSGANSQEVVRLGDPHISTLMDLKQAVKELRWLAEATYTGEALQYSLTNMINRLVKEKSVVIVLTDGRSDTIKDQIPLNVLCGQGLKVGGVGVVDYAGRQPKSEQLDEVVCMDDPRKGFSFVLDNFGMLLDDSFLQNLTESMCEDKKCPTYTCPISFDEPTDVLIMMDSSASVGAKNFKLTQDFSEMLAKRFLSAERKGNVQVRVAVGQYSNKAKMEADFSTNATELAAQIQEAQFQNAGTQVTNALSFAIERFQGSRNRKKLLLFSDGRSQGVNTVQMEEAGKQVHTSGIELYVLAVGPQVNEAHLRTLVSLGQFYDNAYTYRHLFKAPDYRAMLRGVFYQTVSRKISLV
uniref:VWFA domain-containing protein n=1 Tax=Electrophorus electricus TaxID=8005 RepID=A0A4W4FH34_ELEEL